MSHNKIKVKDSHFCNKLDRKLSNKKRRQSETEVIAAFYQHFRSTQKPLEPEFARIVDDHFGEMI